MDIIRNNPYRVLGVLANASRKEIERNKSQIKAFAKVGKTPSFPYDFENILGPVDRSEDNLNDAVSKLTFDKDKVAYGLFWFNNASFVDEETLRRLKESSLDYAVNYLANCGLASYSAYINMVVISLLSSNWICAAYCYTRLFETENIWNQYVHSITKNSSSLSMDEIIDTLADNLINFFPSTNWLTTFQNTSFKISDRTIVCGDKLKTSKLYSVFSTKYVSITTKEIDSLLAQAESINKSDANANLRMAAELELSCKDLLSTLKDSLGNNDSTYVRYADEVALQILNNCIAYYNHDQDNPNRPKNILRLVRFCVRIAEGQTAKDRCKNNFDIVKEAYDNMCPQEVVQYVTYIENQLKESYSLTDIVNSNRLKNTVTTILGKLNDIKLKIGSNDKYYYNLSERVVIFTFNTLIDQINAATRAYDNAPQYNDYAELFQLKKLLSCCKPIVSELELYPQKDATNISYYKQNVEMFYKLYINYHVAEFNGQRTYVPKTSNSQPKVRISGINSARTTTYRQNTPKEKKSDTNSGLSHAEKYLLGFIAIILVIMFILLMYNSNPSHVKEAQSANTETSRELTENPVSTDFSTYEESSETNSTATYEDTDYITGDRPYIDYYGKGKYDRRTKNSLRIENGSESDAVVFLESVSGQKVRHVYIKKGEHFKMIQIPGGKYIIKVFQGNSWNDEKYNGANAPSGGFMENVSMSKSDNTDTFDYPYPKSGRYYEYEVTLYKVENGNFHTEDINTEEMFN